MVEEYGACCRAGKCLGGGNRERKSQRMLCETILWHTLPWQICAPGRTYHHRHILVYCVWLKTRLGDILSLHSKNAPSSGAGRTNLRRGIPYPVCIPEPLDALGLVHRVSRLQHTDCVDINLHPVKEGFEEP